MSSWLVPTTDIWARERSSSRAHAWGVPGLAAPVLLQRVDVEGSVTAALVLSHQLHAAQASSVIVSSKSVSCCSPDLVSVLSQA